MVVSPNFPRPASTPRPVSAFRSNSPVRVSGSRAAKASTEPPVPSCSSGNSPLAGHESCLDTDKRPTVLRYSRTQACLIQIDFPCPDSPTLAVTSSVGPDAQ